MRRTWAPLCSVLPYTKHAHYALGIWRCGSPLPPSQVAAELRQLAAGKHSTPGAPRAPPESTQHAARETLSAANCSYSRGASQDSRIVWSVLRRVSRFLSCVLRASRCLVSRKACANSGEASGGLGARLESLETLLESLETGSESVVIFQV